MSSRCLISYVFVVVVVGVVFVVGDAVVVDALTSVAYVEEQPRVFFFLLLLLMHG